MTIVLVHIPSTHGLTNQMAQSNLITYKTWAWLCEPCAYAMEPHHIGSSNLMSQQHTRDFLCICYLLWQLKQVVTIDSKQHVDIVWFLVAGHLLEFCVCLWAW